MEFHEYANLFPMMPDEEIQKMAIDIKKGYDLDHPILVYQGKILDGRNRWKACQIAGVTPPIKEYTGSDPLGKSVRDNLVRRHLSESQRGMVAGKIAEMQPGDNQYTHEVVRPIGLTSQLDAARMLNVGERTVRRARAVITKGTPELVSAVESSEITVNAACQIAKLPAARQVEVIAGGSAAVKEKAKEIRENGGAEITPSQTTYDPEKRISYQPAKGMEIIARVIAAYDTIGDTDKEFDQATEVLLKHIKHRQDQRNKKRRTKH